MRLKSVILLAALVSPAAALLAAFASLAFAQSVVILSEDGKTAWYGPNGASTAASVGSIWRLSGDAPTPDDPIDPDDPDDPTEDRWGLVAVSETAAKAVTGDPNRDETGSKLEVSYREIGKLVQNGTIPQDKVKSALEMTFRITTGAAQKAWRPWKDAMTEKLNGISWSSAEDAGQGVIDVGIGAGGTSNAAIGDWLQKFLTEWLPFILRLLEIFSVEEIDFLFQGAAENRT